jgi:hypothetical protein
MNTLLAIDREINGAPPHLLKNGRTSAVGRLATAPETWLIMLAVSGYQSKHLCGHLDTDTVEKIGYQAENFGFSVVHWGLDKNASS